MSSFKCYIKIIPYIFCSFYTCYMMQQKFNNILRELFDEPICPSSWTSDIQNCLFQKQSFQIQLLMTIILLRRSPTNTFHIGKISSSSSTYENYCHSISQYFNCQKWMPWLWIKQCQKKKTPKALRLSTKC